MTPVTPSSVCDMQEREAFEAAYVAEFYAELPDIKLRKRDMAGSERLGEYTRDHTQSCWIMWQARAALAERTQQEALTPAQAGEAFVRSLGLGLWPDHRHCYEMGYSDALAARPTSAANSTAGGEGFRDRLQKQCSDWGAYWRASDSHGVELTKPQAVELLADVLGVEVEIKDNGCVTCDGTGKIGDQPCPDCTAAPAAAVEPSTDECECGYGCPPGCGCRHSGEERAAAAPEGLTEPFCLLCDKSGHHTDKCWSTHGMNDARNREIFRLCHERPATPNAKAAEERKPLTADEVVSVMNEAGYGHALATNYTATEKAHFINGIRYAEKAHGIGDQP